MSLPKHHTFPHFRETPCFTLPRPRLCSADASSSLRLLAAVGGLARRQWRGTLPASHFWSDQSAQVSSVGICGSSRNGQVVSLMLKKQCSISNLSAVKKNAML
ncbi:hypothetical protein TNCT_214221 [Trichonephila clavata]|uniref:Uncharacterized protein n=1 Tax=Trichonephila clavata TaxID=2740835 RepID=A0A8X6FU36_TRICU|nr:hypothetical protein TNCT_214221 [Trichonephila clavata]